MSTTTETLSLVKPSRLENYRIDIFNANMDAIDAAIHTAVDNIISDMLTLVPKIYIKYANADPASMAVSLLDTPADYFGICVTPALMPPTNQGAYQWYRIKGDQGGNGTNGVSIASALIDVSGNLVLKFSNNVNLTVGKVVGSDGLPGPKGDPGEDGTSYEWLTSSSNPVSTMGKVGDMYLDTSTNDVYKKTSPTVWTKQGNIMGKSIDNISISETGKIVIGMTDDTTRESGIIITDAITSSSGLAVSSRAVYEAIGNIETLLAAL